MSPFLPASGMWARSPRPHFWNRCGTRVIKEVSRLPQEFDVVCLGGGVAGEALADGLKGSGLTLGVVERELVGGECPYWGCMPSKTLLRSGETLAEAARARVLAASRVEWDVDFPKVSKRVLWMARDLNDTGAAAALEATGAKLIRGVGSLVDLHTVVVGGEQVVARKAVGIANGSTSVIPPVPGLGKGEDWTERQAARRPHLEPDGMTLMVGDPCVAVEGHGADVILPLQSGAIVKADRLLVATGRRANLEAWRDSGLPQTERGWLKVDPSTLEAHADVYGAGDVTGLGGFTHLAYSHGQVIARRLRGEDARADHTAVPRVTFTDPEVASVGLAEAAARERGLKVVTAVTDPAETARGYIHDFHGGTLKLIGDRDRGVLVGATMVTPRAGEILCEMVLAVKVGTPVRDLADVIHPFPAFNRVLGAVLGELAAKLK